MAEAVKLTQSISGQSPQSGRKNGTRVEIPSSIRPCKKSGDGVLGGGPRTGAHRIPACARNAILHSSQRHLLLLLLLLLNLINRIFRDFNSGGSAFLNWWRVIVAQGHSCFESYIDCIVRLIMPRRNTFHLTTTINGSVDGPDNQTQRAYSLEPNRGAFVDDLSADIRHVGHADPTGLYSHSANWTFQSH